MTGVVLAAGATVPAAAGPTHEQDTGPPAWSPPVEGDVVRPFRPAVNAYGAGGHAGVDYRAGAGQPVHAAGRGVVSFTGQVAGAVFVVVAHGHDLRTTYAPMGSVEVRRGDEVERGARLGTASGSGLHADAPGTLHFGLRRGDTPLDPLLLFEPPDLTEVVRLVPADDFTPLMLGTLQGERNRLARWVREAVDRFPVPPVAASRALLGAVRVGQGVHDWATQGECTPRSEARRRRFDTGRRLVAVAGLNSHWSPARTAPFGLPVGDLGYEPSEVTVFSYAPRGGAYGQADTHIGPELAAAHLAARLAAQARENPGEAVDLVGHSQGGVVVEAFLKLHYAGNEREYPPIGTVVTLAAPHRGAPLAGTVRRIDAVPLAAEAADVASTSSDTVPPLNRGSVVALDPHGDFIRRLRDLPLPADIPMTTISAVDDVVVPASRARVDGAEHVVVNPKGWNDHSGILADPNAVAAAGLALTGAPPPCAGLTDAVRARYEPHVVEFLTP